MSYAMNSYRSKRPNPYSGNSYGGGRPGGFTRFKRNDDFVLPHINWSQLNLPPFKKNFYKEHPDVKNRSEEETARIRREKEITVNKAAPKFITTFEESGLPAYILKPIKEMGFDAPTPIQAQSWPIALSGHDMIGIAMTGSGKTLAFLLPAIVHINAQKPLEAGDGPIALIISPTRELAMQIQSQIPAFADPSKIRYTSVYGGAPKYNQLRELSRGVDIVVATPGRLLDFLSSKKTNLKRTTYLVLDEADRMLDMGFEKPIKQILSQIRTERQTVFFSATWPKEIRKLADEILTNPIRVNIGSLEISACKNVKQEFEVVEDHNKMVKILFFLKQMPRNSKVIIFVATKISTNYISDSLRSSGFNSAAINGDKKQYERDMVLRKFKSGEINILVGTDVASRGIDIKDIRVVINYDFPNTIEDYVHRIGRTGRADALGRSYTLITRKNSNKMGDLIKLLKNDKKEIPSELQRLSYGGGGGGGRFNRRNDYNRYRR